ncbi:hypothetical protein OnM2_002039 [Erysiphe neolycopersici]|uniref:Uncharacterized protein n=1 Tax=Erysiphe neolycopersici TaxID=212602 RepID=A0A420I7Z2_9PEZI|nr:hypothetical protein OnM2_002039 [Erysiphe neolycopersici]
MGKSQLFPFPLSSRKNVAKRSESLTRLAPQMSKVQRILGTEAIDLNICTQSKHIPSTKPSICSQLKDHSPLSNLDMFCTWDEGYQESMANISGKASSILGISRDDLDSRKSLSLSVRSYNSMGAPSGSKSWTPRSDDFSRKSSLSSQGVTQSWTSNREPRAENFKAARNYSMAHIATYIDANLDHISELPGDSLFEESPEMYIPRKSSVSHIAIKSRPGSSASCPVATNLKTDPLPENLIDIYPGKKEQSQLSTYEPKRPRFRSENKSLLLPPTPAPDTWLSRQENLQIESLVDQAKKINISSSLIDYDEEHELVPTYSRSPQHSISVSQIDSEPTTPLAEGPFLTVPNFIDLKLSGPWNENQDDPKSSTYFSSNSIPSKSKILNQPVIHTVPSTSSFNSQYFDILGDYKSNQLTPVDIPISSPLYDYFAADKDFQESNLEVQDYSSLSEDKQFAEHTPMKSRHKYVSSTLNVGSSRHASYSSNNSTSIQSDDDEINTQRIPLYIETSAKSWDYSSISSLCIDYDSASSATLLKNEPSHYQALEENLQDNRFSSIYPSTALMEVAQVAQVIRRAPVKEMKVRRKEKPIFTSTNDSSMNVCELSANINME